MRVCPNATDVTTYFKLVDPTTGDEEVDLVITDLDISYVRDLAVAVKADLTALAGATDADRAVAAHADNKGTQIDSTNTPGLYRIDWPDAAFATGVAKVQLVVAGAAIDTAMMEVEIDASLGTDSKGLISTDAQDLKTTLTVGSYLKGILTTALTETGGYLAAGFKNFFNVETPVATVATVNQTGDAYAVVNHADHGNAKLVRSTTPANTLDVAATGEAGLDFNNIKAATGATTLTNITVPIVTTVGTTTTNSDMVAAAPTTAQIVTAMEADGTKLTEVHAVKPATAPPTNTQFEARTLAAADYGTAANQTTIINRIGAFTGTGINTILGFLKALMSKAAALTPSDVGGTFDNTTDSVEAIRDTAPLGSTMRGTDSAALASVCTEERIARLDAAITTRSSHSAANVRTEMDTNSTKLANLDAAVTTRSSHSAANVWAVETRTLSTFGTLVADVAAAVWGAVARTLTSLSGLGHATEAKQDTAQTTLNAMKGADGKCVISTDEQDRSTTLHVNAKKLNGETPYNIPPGGAFM